MNANIGYCYRALGQHAEAVKHFEAYLEEFPFRQHAWKALSYSYYLLEDYEGMTKSAREAIKWDIQKGTFDDYPWQQLATAHFLVGDLSTCLKAARKALGINPRNAFAAYYEACALLAIAQGAELDEPALLEGDPREGAISQLALALKLRPALERDVIDEGHVTELLEEAQERVLSLNEPESEAESEPESESEPEAEPEPSAASEDDA
jgi:tetratricopeptide (TPR) repeat protein